MSAGVILLAHGSPECAGDVPEFMRYVTGGRALPAEVVDEVMHRYALIGKSPLTEMTLRQAAALQQALDVPVYVGMRNWHPFIADSVERMKADGIKQVLAICLAPQNSRTSVGLYRKALMEHATGMEVKFVESWHDHPLLIKAFAGGLRSAMGGKRAQVLFTAHSVPVKTLQDDESGKGDPYAEQCRHTAELVARESGLRDGEWDFAYQSQGMSGGEWIGPTVEATLTRLQQSGVREVLVQPIGFVCDHVEVLYDIDVVFKQFAADRSIALRRPESLNDSPEFIAALAQLAHAHLQTLRPEISAKA